MSDKVSTKVLNLQTHQKKTVAVAVKVSEFNLQLSDIYALQIEPTSHCNARCPHCSRFDEQGNVHKDLTLAHLNIDAIQRNLELSNMINLGTVVLEGDKGDPAMHPKLEKIIELFSLAPSQPLITVVTNGSIRSDTWWQRLAEKKYPNLQVVFSIDGLKDTNHLYRVGLDYDKIMSNVQAFISAGGHAAWKFILFKHNEHQFDQVVEISQQMGFEEFIYTTCRPGEFRGQTKWPVILDGKISHSLEQPCRPKQGIIAHVVKKNKIFNHGLHRERVCPNLSSGRLYINYLNQVIPCCMMHFDTQNQYSGTERLHEMTGGFDQQDLTIYSMTSILNHQFFHHTLKDSLVQGQWHFNCVRSCKPQIIKNLQYV